MAVAYISTRGEAPVLDFADALLTGLARDGGLYVPEQWPLFAPRTLAGFPGQNYTEVAATVLRAFAGNSLSSGVLRQSVAEAYASFRHPALTPLVQIGPNDFLLELFHGPTLAFKDVAMQLLAPLMDRILAARGLRTTIVGATSGDTGGAALHAFAGRDRADVIFLYPHGRVSEVQRRQMTTLAAPNVHAVAVEGTFDDCQGIVKALFNDLAFRDRVALAGVNSINFARIVAQAVYYFVAAAALGGPQRKISFVVPTGNFGDVFAGWVAKRMGLPVDRLVIATNRNDILVRTLDSGRYEVLGVHATSSPSMDIEVASNFERLLFEAGGRDARGVRRSMEGLRQSGAFTLPHAERMAIRSEFDAAAAGEAEVAETMARIWREADYMLDPHTAVAVSAAAKVPRDPAIPRVILSTAHPAKFPDAVEAATGERPPLPAHMSDLLDRPERTIVLPNDVSAIQSFVLAHSRAATGALA
jgi:threonine synthase